ncbi:MAG TPA: fibronectin type III-like domain-contianing protein, partial [Anaerolineales bacterium]
SFARPQKELKAFAKIELAPKATKTLRFTLNREAFWYFNARKGAWSVDPGDFEILVGASSRDIRLSAPFTLQPEAHASRLHTGLPIQTILDDPDGNAVLSKHIGGFILMADMSMARGMTIEQVAENHPTYISRELLAAIADDLAKV